MKRNCHVLVFVRIRMKCTIDEKQRTRRIITAIGISMAVVCISLYCGSVVSYAYTEQAATVNQGARVRKAPVDGEVVSTLGAGAAVTITDETQGSDGHIWYLIRFTSGGGEQSGYIRSDLVTPGGGSSADQEYIAALKAAGFPDSYCPKLLALHQKYPDWQFVPVLTGLDWSTSVEKESVAGRNLVPSSVNDARKATDSAAYDWATNKWYGYDGAGWVCASQDYIAYCMDPRNFLDETYIFQFETLESAPYQTVQGVSGILAGTFMAGNYTDTDGAVKNYAQTFTEVAAGLAVSPYHLAARCRQEQGAKGTSPLISGKYKDYAGYYNFFNVRAFTTGTASAAVNGLAYAKEQGWNSIYKSIAGGAKIVADSYVKKGQNTIYFEKFNVVYAKSLYSHQYMTNVMAAISEGSTLGKAYTDKKQAFQFRIPVYTNMPESAVGFSDSGNPNNWLSSLTVEGAALTPGFSAATTEYSLIVGADVSSVNVTASPVASVATVSGTGNYPLGYGDNTIQVNCVSQSGETRTYTIHVARQQGADSEAQPPENQNEPVIYGDINGDGKVSNLDLVLLQKHILGISVLEGRQAEAADTSRDGRISNKDMVILQKQILGIAPVQ